MNDGKNNYNTCFISSLQRQPGVLHSVCTLQNHRLTGQLPRVKTASTLSLCSWDNRSCPDHCCSPTLSSTRLWMAFQNWEAENWIRYPDVVSWKLTTRVKLLPSLHWLAGVLLIHTMFIQTHTGCCWPWESTNTSNTELEDLILQWICAYVQM